MWLWVWPIIFLQSINTAVESDIWKNLVLHFLRHCLQVLHTQYQWYFLILYFTMIITHFFHSNSWTFEWFDNQWCDKCSQCLILGELWKICPFLFVIWMVIGSWWSWPDVGYGFWASNQEGTSWHSSRQANSDDQVWRKHEGLSANSLHIISVFWAHPNMQCSTRILVSLNKQAD